MVYGPCSRVLSTKSSGHYLRDVFRARKAIHHVRKQRAPNTSLLSLRSVTMYLVIYKPSGCLNQRQRGMSFSSSAKAPPLPSPPVPCLLLQPKKGVSYHLSLSILPFTSAATTRRKREECPAQHTGTYCHNLIMSFSKAPTPRRLHKQNLGHKN